VIFNLLHPAQSELFATVIWSLRKRWNLKLWQQQDETSMQVETS